MSIESWAVLAAIYAVLTAAWIIAKPLKEQPKPRPYAGLEPKPLPKPEMSAYTAEEVMYQIEMDAQWKRICNQIILYAILQREIHRNDDLPE